MNDSTKRVIVGQMHSREKHVWTPVQRTNRITKRLLRNTGIFAAVSLCIATGAYMLLNGSQTSQSVMSHLTAGFEYDDSLGRLQFVSHVLPESAMVFLNSDQNTEMFVPTKAEKTHEWSGDEPWIEYAHGSVFACDDGEIMTVVKNRQDEFTVRILHQDGYESIYSGLNDISVGELETVAAGQLIGNSSQETAFELRKEGRSVLPVFAQ